MGKKNSKRMILRDKPNVKKRKNKAKKKTVRHQLEDKQAPRTSPIALARTVLEKKRDKRRLSNLQGTLNIQKSTQKRVSFL